MTHQKLAEKRAKKALRRKQVMKARKESRAVLEVKTIEKEVNKYEKLKKTGKMTIKVQTTKWRLI